METGRGISLLMNTRPNASSWWTNRSRPADVSSPVRTAKVSWLESQDENRTRLNGSPARRPSRSRTSMRGVKYSGRRYMLST